MLNTPESQEQQQARWEQQRAEWQSRYEEFLKIRELAISIGFPADNADNVDGHVCAYVFGRPRAKVWHLRRDCPAVKDGQEPMRFYAAAHELAEFVHLSDRSGKPDPCTQCALPLVLELALRLAGDDAQQCIVTCAQVKRERHTRCADCARLVELAARLSAPVYRDGYGFTVAGLRVPRQGTFPLRRRYAVHVPPEGFTTTLGRDGLMLAWTLRKGAPSRLVPAWRDEYTKMFHPTGSPAWIPASLVVPPGT